MSRVTASVERNGLVLFIAAGFDPGIRSYSLDVSVPQKSDELVYESMFHHVRGLGGYTLGDLAADLQHHEVPVASVMDGVRQLGEVANQMLHLGRLA
ncbi:hypothetical protein [Deinococcus ruber]|uniref:Uncharacterized protein n=1 Tax=Deinococcus ruber TaxID=1848197 RepID=A0A918CA92_9DEIO|nr:hypothetical protein [Deinococcus ruber]GGR13039.1 hypothetical protein GCM10008957_27490 [Deinococcus ruber]